MIVQGAVPHALPALEAQAWQQLGRVRRKSARRLPAAVNLLCDATWSGYGVVASMHYSAELAAGPSEGDLA